MIVHTEAVVLHSIRYGEADLIATLFTKESGLTSYLLRGVLKSKKGKLRSALFLPLTVLDIEAVHKNKGTLERIKEAKRKHSYANIHEDIVKRSLVFFLAEILKNSIKEEEANPELYEFMETTIAWLDAHQDVANFHIVFMIKLTQYLGFYPDTSDMTHSYFNLQEGCFQHMKTNRYCIQGEKVEKLKIFLGTKFDDAMHVKLSKIVRTDIIDLLLVYFELHLHEFKKPKSQAILNEIFS